MEHDTDRTNDRRVTVLEAAELLGITPDAVRARLRRGTMRKERAEDGTLLVVLDGDTTTTDQSTEQATVPYINALRSQIELLQRELENRKEEARRYQHLLAAALERIPAIEAPVGEPSEQRESTVTASEDLAKGAVSQESADGEITRPWWQRLFGG